MGLPISRWDNIFPDNKYQFPLENSYFGEWTIWHYMTSYPSAVPLHPKPSPPLAPSSNLQECSNPELATLPSGPYQNIHIVAPLFSLSKSSFSPKLLLHSIHSQSQRSLGILTHICSSLCSWSILEWWTPHWRVPFWHMQQSTTDVGGSVSRMPAPDSELILLAYFWVNMLRITWSWVPEEEFVCYSKRKGYLCPHKDRQICCRPRLCGP